MVKALDGAAFAAIMANLRIDFVERSKERLLAMQEDAAALATADPKGRDAAVLALLREAHSLKGTGGSFGFAAITVIAHRLEDYLANGGEHAIPGGVHRFLDTMQDILEVGHDPDSAALATLLARLPG